MALYKRNKTWHTDFSVNGQRFRQSLETSDWREAQAKEKELIAQASQGKLAVAQKDFARLGFSEAAQRYLARRRQELSYVSQKKESQLLVQPCNFFRSESLSRLTADRLLSYREWRARQEVGPACINMEIGVIRRMLKLARRWHLLAADIRPLKERRTVGRAMGHDEKYRLMRLASTNPGWQVARLAMLLALNTTMRGCELKALRWSDVDLLGKVLTIRKSKTDAGERVVPLNRSAFRAVLELRERAQAFGGLNPTDFLFPACENAVIDPKRPQKSWRSAWRQLARAVECPACHKVQPPADVCRNKQCKADIHELRSPTAGLRFHDLRHHAITELAESQASDQTIMSIAGHVSPKMLAHYSHVRLEAKRVALESLAELERGGPKAGQGEAGYVTKNVTNGNLEQAAEAEVLEKNGRPEWTRTIDLFRVKEAL
jgi:integrase